MDIKRSLPSLIRDITLHYVKFYYEKYLKDNNISIIEETDLIKLLDDLYDEKQKDLRIYIRTTLKDNLKENYSPITTENILMEMFKDSILAKERVKVEILYYQNNQRNQNNQN